MKLSITEFRDMLAEAVRRTVTEARKKKDVPPSSEESRLAQRDRHVRSLPGYAHGDASLDMSTPQGRKNLARRQGASNMGNWTSEALANEGSPMAEYLRKLIRMVVAEEIRVRRGR